MLTQYDQALAVVDTEWLNRVGTAYAIAYYEAECYRLIQKQGQVERKTKLIDNLLGDDSDPTGELENHLQVMHSAYLNELHKQLKAAENQLVAVKALEWVDSTASPASLQELGNPKLITKEEFEGSWQKVEAGY